MQKYLISCIKKTCQTLFLKKTNSGPTAIDWEMRGRLAAADDVGLGLVWHSFAKSCINSFSRSYPNALFCNSFLLEADGEAPSKMNWGGEARNPGFDMLLRQAHVSRCSFVLQLFTAKLPLSYLFLGHPAPSPVGSVLLPVFPRKTNSA